MNFTWAFNLVGKQAQLQAYNSGELAYTQDHEFNLSELPSKMFNAILGRTNQATKAPVIGNAVAQAATSSGASNGTYSSKQSFAPRANLNTSGNQNSDSQLQVNTNSNNAVNKGNAPFIAAAAKLHAQKVPRLPRSSGTGAYIGSLDGPKAELVGVRAQKSDGNRFERQQMQVARAVAARPMVVRPLTTNFAAPSARIVSSSAAGQTGEMSSKTGSNLMTNGTKAKSSPAKSSTSKAKKAS